MKKKFIGSKKNPSNNIYYTPNQPLQELVYDYNIRGWMLGVNRDYMLTEGQTSDGKYFGFELGYDKATTKSGRNFTSTLQYNGNITGMVWKSDGDDIRRKYDFSYDAVNRLMKGDFEQQNGDDHAWNSSKVNYNMKMGDGTLATSAYDANGNIKAITQFGYRLGVASTTPIDNLTYSYNPNTNKLAKVTDAINSATSKLGDFKDGSNAALDDYTYDVNGNLVKDLNKDIVTFGGSNGITYNHLNLPSVITIKKDATTNKGTITYTYDAAGNKQKKVTTETNAVVPFNGTNYTSNITTTTTYLGGSVFETKDYSHAALVSLKYTDRLLFIGQEEGRVRFKTENSTLHYDYMLKDHLGNVRMVLTEEVQTDMYPAATMETATAANEELYYSNLPLTRTINLPAGYPSNTPAGNAKVAVVKAASGYQKIGPAITLKVMAGDKFNLTVNSWYKKNGVTPGTPVSLASELISALAGNMAGVGGKASVTEITNSGVLNAVTPQFLNSQTVAAGVPKAYINWILFDEQFKIVSSNSSFEQVGADLQYKTHIKTNMPINKSGYLYIYVSNETPNIDVFFDNLQVTHVRGPILEETHYYPFGLVQAGISSKAAGGLENKRKWNKGSELESKEFSDGSGLELYSTFYRGLDPQLGRFWQIDPKPDYSKSLYSSMDNNPISINDPLGDTIVPIFIPQRRLPNVYQNHLNYINKHPNEGFSIFGYTLLIFNYEPDKKKQEKNRTENKKANPVNNSDPNKQEDEVAPASTKEGGARGVRMAVPKEENASHGGQIGAQVKYGKLKDGDQFLVILIPDSGNKQPETKTASVPDAGWLNALEKIIDKFLPRIIVLPELLPQSTKGSPIFN